MVARWFKKKKPILAIDIGNKVVKAVQLGGSAQNLVLDYLGIAEIKPTGEEQETVSINAQIEAIQRAVIESGSPVRDAISSVAGEGVIVRYLDFPYMNKEELGEAIRLQLSDLIPYPPETVQLDFYSLTDPETGKLTNKMEVVLVAAVKELIEQKATLLRSAGLNPVIIDTDSFALVNCVEVNYSLSPDETVAVVDIGAQNTKINIIANGQSRFSRDFPVGGNRLTKEISMRLNLSFVDAEKLKIEHGLGGTESGGYPEVTSALTQSLSNLISELNRSFRFFETQPKGRPVDRILLSGGTALMLNLDSYLTKELGIKTEIINPLQKIDTRRVSGGVANINQIAPTLTVGIGLAARAIYD